MTINYLLYISDFTGCKTEQISGIFLLSDLLKALCKKYGVQFHEHVLTMDMKDLSKDIVVLINGKNVALHSGMDTVLHEEDTVSILPEIMGG